MLKHALFAGAALFIGAMYTQGAVTPALAGPNVKPKVTVKPRIRVVKPKIRLKIDPKRFVRDKDKKNTTDPTNLQAKITGQPTVTGNADQAFQAILGDFIEAAAAAKEAAEAAEAASNIKGFNPAIEGLVKVDPKEGLPDGDGGNTGNNEGPIGMSPDEFADRFGASKTAREAEAAGLADRFGAPGSGSSAVGDWSKSTGIAPDYTRIPTGGLASSTTTTHRDGDATTSKTTYNDGAVSVTKTSVGGGAVVISSRDYNPNGDLIGTRYTAAFEHGKGHTVHRDWDIGVGVYTNNRGERSAFRFDRETGGYVGPLDRTQTGEEQTTSTLPPPSCGSAACNALRRGLGIRSIIAGAIRSNPGPDGATPTTQGPSVSALINQDDLVKTNVAGDAANSETNRTARELKDKGVRY